MQHVQEMDEGGAEALPNDRPEWADEVVDETRRADTNCAPDKQRANNEVEVETMEVEPTRSIGIFAKGLKTYEKADPVYSAARTLQVLREAQGTVPPPACGPARPTSTHACFHVSGSPGALPRRLARLYV